MYRLLFLSLMACSPPIAGTDDSPDSHREEKSPWTVTTWTPTAEAPHTLEELQLGQLLLGDDDTFHVSYNLERSRMNLSDVEYWLTSSTGYFGEEAFLESPLVETQIDDDEDIVPPTLFQTGNGIGRAWVEPLNRSVFVSSEEGATPIKSGVWPIQHLVAESNSSYDTVIAWMGVDEQERSRVVIDHPHLGRLIFQDDHEESAIKGEIDDFDIAMGETGILHLIVSTHDDEQVEKCTVQYVRVEPDGTVDVQDAASFQTTLSWETHVMLAVSGDHDQLTMGWTELTLEPISNLTSPTFFLSGLSDGVPWSDPMVFPDLDGRDLAIDEWGTSFILGEATNTEDGERALVVHYPVIDSFMATTIAHVSEYSDSMIHDRYSKPMSIQMNSKNKPVVLVGLESAMIYEWTESTWW